MRICLNWQRSPLSQPSRRAAEPRVTAHNTYAASLGQHKARAHGTLFYAETPGNICFGARSVQICTVLQRAQMFVPRIVCYICIKCDRLQREALFLYAFR